MSTPPAQDVPIRDGFGLPGDGRARGPIERLYHGRFNIRQNALVSPRSSDTDFDRLRSNIQEELQAQNALRDLGLDDQTLAGLADGIAVNVDYAFDVAWAPKWVRPGEAHYWSEPSDELPRGENHYVECLTCEWVSSHNATRRDAEQKYGRHRQQEHPANS